MKSLQEINEEHKADNAITIPAESIITFNKNGIINSTVLSEVKIPLNQKSVESFLMLLGTTPQKIITHCTKNKKEV